MQVAEISRVLKPGGVFIGSTFLKASAPLGQLLNNDDLVRPLNMVIHRLHDAFLEFLIANAIVA
jgi:SAM-dependent methyltransferase